VTGEREPRTDLDSRARSLLANERTFLAWVRTGLSMLAIGIAAAQFIGRDEVNGIHIVTIFSLFLAVSGVMLTVFGGIQFARGRDQINTGTYRSSTTAVGLTVAMAIIAGVVGIAIILIIRQPI
jgi:putative membrane protein